MFLEIYYQHTIVNFGKLSYFGIQHSQDTNTLNKINQQPWDYVVLQDQSQRPSLEPSFVDTAVIPYALFLDSVIHANNFCTQTVFYMTWGRKYGDAGNCAFYPPVCTYAGMQQRLKESYLQMSDTCHAIVSPVGEAFNLSIQTDSTLNLYVADNSHPSVEGSFLAACTFYGTILHKQIINQNYTAGLSITAAAYLQNIAWQTVRDSSMLWNLGVNEPFAYFNFQNIGNLQVQFICPGNLNYQNQWNFGDTTFSTLPEPLHQYLYSYYFPVTHVVFDGCRYDSVTAIINATGQLSVEEIKNTTYFSYFDKNSNNIVIHFLNTIPDDLKILVRDVEGKIISEKNVFHNSITTEIDAEKISNGFYFLQLKSINQESEMLKIIVTR